MRKTLKRIKIDLNNTIFGENNLYLDGEKHGYWIDSNNTKGNYKYGLKEGLWVCFNYKNERLYTTMYKNGKKHGKCCIYVDDVIMSFETYRNGLLHGLSIDYQSTNSNLPKKEMYYENGLLEGKAYYYGEGKDLERVNTYKNGKRYGESIIYHRNKIHIRQNIKNDKQHGLCEVYSTINHEVLVRRLNYKDGIQHGLNIVLNSSEYNSRDFYI